MSAPIFGEANCFICNHSFKYVGELGSTKMIETQSVIAESVLATGNFLGTSGRMVELEIIVKCPECESKNKVTNTIPSM